MKRKAGIVCMFSFLFGVMIALSMFFFSSTFAFDLSSFSVTDLHFSYNGNSFWWKLFFKDFKSVSETVVLNSVRKSCTKQVRWYYFNPARGLRVWPLDQDSLSYLRSTDSSYNNLSLSGGIFICNDSSMALYGSIAHHWKFNTYYLIAGVNYSFIDNSYLPNFMQSMLFVNGLSIGYMFDSYGGIASLFGSWLMVDAVCGNGIVESPEICDQWANNGKVWYCNVSCDGMTSSNTGGWGWGWGGWWGWGWGWGDTSSQEDIEIPLATGLQIISGLHLDDSWAIVPNTPVSWQDIATSVSPYSEELTKAYLYAYKIGITTQWPIARANLQWTLIRKHAAKMISQFAINVLHKQPNELASCNFYDMKEETLEMQYYAQLACRLGIMGLQSDGTPNVVFSPNATVTRAQFGTMLSRLLYGSTYNAVAKGNDYYSAHLKALQKNSIMKNISTPWNFELRGNVMIMMMRVDAGS